MAEYMAIPDGWSEVSYEIDDGYEAMWACEEHQIAISATESTDADGTEAVTVIVQQHIEDDEHGVATDVQTHALVADTREDAERMAAEFMHEVNDGQHVMRLLSVDEWKEFYQFYCISDSEVPDDVTADELVESLADSPAQVGNDIDDLPDDTDPMGDADMTVTVDIFPRHTAEVANIDTENE